MDIAKKPTWFILIALLVANVFKILKLDVMSLWHDESFSALLIQYDLKEMIYRITLDVHPPLYYLLLKGWAFIFGGELFSIRMFSLTFGVLTVLALYFLVKKLLGQKAAILSSVILALNSFQAQYDMEARMYTLGTFFIVISSYFIIKALESRKLHWWIFYSLTAVAAMYTHYYTFFWIGSQAIFAAAFIIKNSGFSFKELIKNKNLILAKVSYLLILILYLPWLKVLLKQLAQVQENYWIGSMSVWSVPNTLLSLITGGSLDPAKAWYILLITTIIVVAAFFLFLKRTDTFYKWFFFLMVIIPFCLATIMSLKTSIYLDRYFIFTLPFFLAMISGAALLINKKSARKIIITILLVGTLISFPLRWADFKIENKPGMKAAAQFLNESVSENNKIFIGSSFCYFTFKYYNETGIKPLLYAPDALLHYSGTALLNEEDIISDFKEETKTGDVVWMINTTGFGNWQPNVPVEWEKLEEKGFEDTYNYRGWIIATKYRAID